MTLKRREFLRRGLAFGSVCALPSLAWSKGARRPDGARTLVVLHLNGGNDGLNTVIPYKDARYRVLRPSLAIDRSRVRKIHEQVGLHPALAGFEQLWGKDRLAVVQGVGYPQPNYSHFRATEIYYTAQPEKTPTDGWLGRTLDAHPEQKPLRAIALGRERPLALQGASPGVVTLNDFKQFQLPPDTEDAVALYAQATDGNGASAAVARRAQEALRVAKRIAALRPARAGFYGPLGNDLAKAIALLRTDLDLEVIHLSFGGFDTHAAQGGRHNGLLGQVGNNLRHFQNLLDRDGLADQVTTFVFSEFGRRAQENLSGGTDHGSAYPAFVIGKGVRPGLHGTAPSLENLDRGNLRYTTDFRSLYAGLLRDVLRRDPRPTLGNHTPLELFA